MQFNFANHLHIQFNFGNHLFNSILLDNNIRLLIN